MLKRYIMVGLVHFSIDRDGVFKSKAQRKLDVEFVKNAPLESIEGDQVPPTARSVSDLLKKIMAKNMGKLGESLEMFVFDGKGFDSCADGVVNIIYNNEKYEFITPLPGC